MKRHQCVVILIVMAFTSKAQGVVDWKFSAKKTADKTYESI